LTSANAVMRLASRDRALLTVLHELRYLTVSQVQQVCYPSISVRSTSHRLSILGRRGVLHRLSHRSFTDRRSFWGLAPLGRAAAVGLTGIPAAPPIASTVAAMQIEHLIATNQIFCDLCREHRSGTLPPFRWYGSHHTRVDLGETCVVPDAIIAIEAPESGWWLYCLERDRGTMPRSALDAKFERYSLMYRLAPLRAADRSWEGRGESWMLFACDDERRAGAIAGAAARFNLDHVWAGLARDVAPSLAASTGSPLYARPMISALTRPECPSFPGGIVPPDSPAPSEPCTATGDTARPGRQERS
jgi:Replication-relaxation